MMGTCKYCEKRRRGIGVVPADHDFLQLGFRNTEFVCDDCVMTEERFHTGTVEGKFNFAGFKWESEVHELCPIADTDNDIIGMTIEFDHAMEHADIASLKEQGYVVDKVWVHAGFLYVDIVEIGR